MTPRNSRGSRSRSSSSSSSSRAGSKAGASGASKQKQSRQRTGSSSGRGASRAAASSLALEGRSRVILVLFGILALLFFGRLFFLQVIVSDQYTAQAQETRTVNIPTTPRRGTIYDRNGIVLAISVDATTIYANPKEIENPDHTAMVLAEVLGGQVSDYRTMITRPNTTFSYVKRQADVEEADRLREEKLPGIYFIDDSRREYPNGSIGGQIVGCTDWVMGSLVLSCNTTTSLKEQREPIALSGATRLSPRAHFQFLEPCEKKRRPSMAKTSWFRWTLNCRTVLSRP